MRGIGWALAAMACLFVGFAALSVHEYAATDLPFREGDLRSILIRCFGVSGVFAVAAIALAIFERKSR